MAPTNSDQLRQDTAPKTQILLARHLASLRPTRCETPDDSNRYTLRSLARLWIALDTEASELETVIEGLVLKYVIREVIHLVRPAQNAVQNPS